MPGDSPANGDVVITSEGGRHLLRVLPNPARISFAHLADAVEVAKRHADNADARIWRAVDGEIKLLTISEYLRLARAHARKSARRPLI